MNTKTSSKKTVKTQKNGLLSLPFAVGILSLLFVMAAPVSAMAQLFYVSDSSGGKIYTIPVTGGSPTAFVSTSNPYGLAYDSVSGVIYESTGGNTIKKITLGGTVTSFVTVTGDSQGLAVDTSGNLYSLNYSGSSIQKITSGGSVSTFATGFDGPDLGVTYAAASNSLYASTYTSNILYKITSGGTVSTVATLAGGAGAEGIAIDDSGNFYVALYNTGAIAKISPDGLTVNNTWVTGLSRPTGLIYVDGNLYETDSTSGTVKEISLSGSVSVFSSGFATPSDIVFVPAVVPEPGSVALIIMGGGLLWVVVCRRKSC